MADNEENRLPLVVQDLRYIQSANHVLAECLSRIIDESGADKTRQTERLVGVSYLMGLVGQQVDQAQLILKEEIASR